VVALDLVGSEVRAVLARSDVSAKSRIQFVALGSALSGQPVQGVLLGLTELRTEGVTVLDLGRTLYLSAQPGRATKTPPSAPGTSVVEVGTLMEILAPDRARVLFRVQRVSVNL
jgi:hypothetical protein